MSNDLETDVHLSLVQPTFDADPDWDSDVTAPSASDGLDVSPALDPMRVLIVDDAPSTRRFLRAVLEHCREFTVVGEASNGNSAVRQAETLHPDLVLLDLSMPTSDGASALAGILKSSPDAQVIVVSGMSPTVGGMMLDAGAIAFISKGLSPFDLIDRLADILGRSITVENEASLDNADRSVNQKRTSTYIPAVSGHRAVVFEDEQMTRSLITKALTDCDVSVVSETDNPSTALAVVDLAQPELVVLDISQKGTLTPGTDVISEICRRSPRSVVIVYSKFEEWRERALAAGAASFVTKPRVDDLIDRIRQLAPSR